ncbi:gp128 [Sphingomonas phage PAU]|uniref:gp128 n=1 Tax=Sphingomonas phage PAU TaxID=1150991 RepID=UPI0002573273|nr:gp128 [Sphingomonas phage PAU]AFF28126.1 gp128 [Sphingomonas phage PAU]
MVIKFQSIDEKTLTKENDTDLLSKLWSLRNAEVSVQELVVIDKVTAMRLDLFCMAYYKTLDDFDLFLKVNGIVNPFEEPIGRVLIMPELTSLKASIDKINLNSIANDKIKTVSTDGMSKLSNRKTRRDTTRAIGFKRLENGNLVF